MSPVGYVASFDEALEIVLGKASGVGRDATQEESLLDCGNRVLAEVVVADRDQPPFDRSARDGFAVKTKEALGGVELAVIGQVRAGEMWSGKDLEHGTAIEIMTGAPVPAGADAVVMVEHVERPAGPADVIRLAGAMQSGENIVPRGSEAGVGERVLAVGTVIEGAEIALAAACGYSSLTVFRKPTVAIVATGDELVELDVVPELQQIRNSNSYGLAALVDRAGGAAVRLRIAPDRRDELENIIKTARGYDLMLLSGGVSMGKYDLVEEVLASRGAEFFFTGVRMQPGKPLVFGRLPADGEFPARFFFGLPGNPVSAQVTFHCFVAPMLRAMCGAGVHAPNFAQATLGEDVAGKAGVMRVLPARLTADRVRPEVRLVRWQGSGDLAANARANCYAVLPPEKERFTAGDVITVLLR
jgi:molybdopterin molybdotransferase